LDSHCQNILKPLAYFDIFHYPLTRDEIRSYAADTATAAATDRALGALVAAQKVFVTDGLYMLHNEPGQAVARRRANQLAQQRMQAARKAAAIIARFPFVEAVAVSGSLSKNFADAKTDIDFFVITTANRLWVARTLLHLLKKLSFVTGSQHLFCMNYFVDTAMLQIAEQNVFTATEIVTLVPMYGPDVLQRFVAANGWTAAFFPLRQLPTSDARPVKKGWLARLAQRLLGGAWGNGWDDRLMRITDRRWQKKAGRNQTNSRGIKMGLVASKHFSKPDPANFQQKVVERFEAKMAQLLGVEKVGV
jgi:predicted nucleotidyltransferase